MTAHTMCPHCKHVYHLDEGLRGKKARCKSCQHAFIVEFVAEETGQSTGEEAAAKHVEPTPSRPPREDRSTPGVDTSPGPHRRIRRHRTVRGHATWRIVSLAVAGVVVVGVLGLLWVFVGKRLLFGELPQVLAELDRSSPGWRQEELEARRAVVPDAQNSALTILASQRLIGKEAMPSAVQKAVDETPPAVQLNAPQSASLHATLQRLQPALAEARQVANLPTGRYAITYARDGISTKLPHTQGAREVANLLHLDAVARGQEGDVEGALASCQAIMNVARSFSDEPISLSQLVRLACATSAVASLERALAQGQASEASLAVMQRLLEDEAAQPVLLIMVRGERALMHTVMTALQKGELKAEDLFKLSKSQPLQQSPSTRDVQRAHVWLLRHLTRSVEIAQLPAHEQLQQIDKWQAAVAEAPPLARLLLAAVPKAAAACQRVRARLSCAATAVAVERYRLVQGRWPDSLKALVPAQLARVPADPFDGQPLRFTQHADGVVIYAVGPDLQDNQGAVDDSNTGRAGTDVVFRLWDVTRRRQPAQR